MAFFHLAFATKNHNQKFNLISSCKVELPLDFKNMLGLTVALELTKYQPIFCHWLILYSGSPDPEEDFITITSDALKNVNT